MTWRISATGLDQGFPCVGAEAWADATISDKEGAFHEHPVGSEKIELFGFGKRGQACGEAEIFVDKPGGVERWSLLSAYLLQRQ